MPRMSFWPDWKGVWKFLTDPGAGLKPKFFAVLAIAYLLWPIDFLPDLAPLIGWLDDLGFIGLATAYLLKASGDYTQRISKKGD